MDIPERIVTAENTRLWRFRTPVLNIPKDGSATDFRADGPVPVKSDGKVVGHATFDRVGDQLIAEVGVDYAIPERLDVQNGTKVWLVPMLSIEASVAGVYEDTQTVCEIPTVVKIVDLVFSTNERLYVPPIEVSL